MKGEGLPKSHGGESQERNGGDPTEGSERSQTAGDGQQRQAQTEFRGGVVEENGKWRG